MIRTAEFQAILGDIALAAAMTSCGVASVATGDYQPGAIRQLWLAAAAEGELRRRVNALATAGTASLCAQPATALLAAAATYGVPLDADTAEAIAGHFAARRDALMTYDR